MHNIHQQKGQTLAHVCLKQHRQKKKRTNKLDKHKTLLLRAYTERFEHKINGDRNSDHHRILINYSQNSKMLSIRDVEHSAQIHIIHCRHFFGK